MKIEVKKLIKTLKILDNLHSDRILHIQGEKDKKYLHFIMHRRRVLNFPLQAVLKEDLHQKILDIRNFIRALEARKKDKDGIIELIFYTNTLCIKGKYKFFYSLKKQEEKIAPISISNVPIKVYKSITQVQQAFLPFLKNFQTISQERNILFDEFMWVNEDFDFCAANGLFLIVVAKKTKLNFDEGQLIKKHDLNLIMAYLYRPTYTYTLKNFILHCLETDISFSPKFYIFPVQIASLIQHFLQIFTFSRVFIHEISLRAFKEAVQYFHIVGCTELTFFSISRGIEIRGGNSFKLIEWKNSTISSMPRKVLKINRECLSEILKVFNSSQDIINFCIHKELMFLRQNETKIILHGVK